METTYGKKSTFNPVSLFKSYYVVWKLINDINSKDTVERFKSYYVVWKLEWVFELFPSGGWFKSYYVVWKLQKNKEKKTDISGLNRTM